LTVTLLGTLLVVPAIRQYGWKKPIILTLRNICEPRFKKPLIDLVLKGDGFDQTLVRHLLFAIHKTVSKETVQEGLNYLKVEVPNYWSDHKRSLEVLHYLSRLEHIPHLLTKCQREARRSPEKSDRSKRQRLLD
jgi:hypothetical protein